MSEGSKVRDRFAEFVSLREGVHRNLRTNTNAGTTGTGSAPPVAVWNPPWIRALEQFTELEQITGGKLDHLSEIQRGYLRPKFLSDDEEEKQRDAVDKATTDVQRFLKELDRLVINGMAPRDPTNSEEVWIAANARKHLSTRLNTLLRRFKTGQEYYGNQLAQRERKMQKYMKFGSDESHQRVQQESKAASFMELGYTEADIQGLLLEEAHKEQVNQEIKDILKGVQDIQSMFEDLNTLVAQQGTILDRIDYNIQQTDVDVSRALEQLKKAQEHQESSCVLM